jgi:hypothetical protein
LPHRAKIRTFCAPVKPQKVLVVEPLLYPISRAPFSSAVLTASSDHLGQVTYSPFDAQSLQLPEMEFN